MANGSGDWLARLELFAQGRACYRQRRWTEAQAIFQKILERWPDDGPVRAFWTRSQDYLFEEPEANWDGIYVMAHK